MILKALVDYYNRNIGRLPTIGRQLKQIGFIITIDKDGNFLHIEDARDGDSAPEHRVCAEVPRTSGIAANLLYDKAEYVIGYSGKEGTGGRSIKMYDAFKTKIDDLHDKLPDNEILTAVYKFYQNGQRENREKVTSDPCWPQIEQNLDKRYSLFSFRVSGDYEIIAEKNELINAYLEESIDGDYGIDLITGFRDKQVRITGATPITGSQAKAKIVSFQVNQGLDSYGKTQCANAPIGEKSEFAFRTALMHMAAKGSRNKFTIGDRTYIFWGGESYASRKAEETVYALFNFDEPENDEDGDTDSILNAFNAVYTGDLKLGDSGDDVFHVLGLAPNIGRVAVCHWSETPLKYCCKCIADHIENIRIVGRSLMKSHDAGLYSILKAVRRQNDLPPNLADSLAVSVFRGGKYPDTLLTAAISKAKSVVHENEGKGEISQTLAGVMKAYLNRLNSPQIKRIETMLDKTNDTPAYLCGRLFATLVKVQEEANNISSLKERYMSSASSTPATIFPLLLKLNVHHMENLKTEGLKVKREKLMQEIISKLPASDGFPDRLDLHEQACFFVGYYQQRQDFFLTKSAESDTVEEN